jgi:hypothetical protein
MSVRLSFSSPPSPPFLPRYLPSYLPSSLTSNSLPQPNALTYPPTYLQLLQLNHRLYESLPPSTSIETKIYLVYVIGVIAGRVHSNMDMSGFSWLNPTHLVKPNTLTHALTCSLTHPLTYPPTYLQLLQHNCHLYESLPPSLHKHRNQNILGLCDWSHSKGGALKHGQI